MCHERAAWQNNDEDQVMACIAVVPLRATKGFHYNARRVDEHWRRPRGSPSKDQHLPAVFLNLQQHR
jgi:hypothetical protein